MYDEGDKVDKRSSSSSEVRPKSLAVAMGALLVVAVRGGLGKDDWYDVVVDAEDDLPANPCEPRVTLTDALADQGEASTENGIGLGTASEGAAAGAGGGGRANPDDTPVVEDEKGLV
jgi:hypothetical protein